jgi:hypothetical protein
MEIMNRYTLQDFTNITFNGFDIKLPDETIAIITELAQQVGSPTYIRTPIFNKVENSLMNNVNYDYQSQNVNSGDSALKKKKRGNKPVEVLNDEDWETIRSFQATVIEQKSGLEGQIDLIRSALNKMSEKNYEVQTKNILEILDELIEKNATHEDMLKVGNSIFEIASNNRFYSKLYADLYSELIKKYEIMQTIFENNFNTFLEIFNNIEHVNSEEDYNLFCKINKENERRKSLSSFFVNLTLNGIIKKEKLVDLTSHLLRDVIEYINLENKKLEVDEMIENISILYNKNWIETCDNNINGENFMEIVKRLALSKSKKFPSLSNKSIFKFMDMIEM